MEWLLTGGGISKVTKNSYREQEKQFKFNLVKSFNNYFNICTVFTIYPRYQCELRTETPAEA